MSERMSDESLLTLASANNPWLRKWRTHGSREARIACDEALRRGEEAEQWKARAEAAEREREGAVRALHSLRRCVGAAVDAIDAVPRTMAQTCAEEAMPAASFVESEAPSSQRDPLMPERVESKPGVMGGTPVIKGTRIPTSSINSLFQRGFDFDHIVRLYLSITKKDACDAVRYEIRRRMANEEDTGSEAPAPLTAESVARALEAASRGFDAALDSAGETEDSAKVLRGLRAASVKAARALRGEE